MQSQVTTRTMADVVAQEKAMPSAGRMFAEAVRAKGTEASLELDFTITDRLTSMRRKPRYPVRNMLRIVDLSRDPRTCYWHESPPRPGDPPVEMAELRRELASRFHRSPMPELVTTTAWVQVPPDMWEDLETFESFLNHRLIIRLGTAENYTLVRAPGGLLDMPQLGRMTDPGPFASTILHACNAVEQMGGTADGMILNPTDYYRFLGSSRLMQIVEDNGVQIVRTRLVDEGYAIVGDFGHGAQLFDAGRSLMTFADPPPGTFAEPGLAVKAEIYERVVVNLPTNFYIVSL